MPVFQSYLFDVLRGNGESETTDDKFGPYMEKAVKIYQSTNGLYTLNRPGSGVIDKKTYQLLLSQNEKRPGPGPEPPKPPTPTPSPVVQQQTPKPEFSNQKTKF
jgi:peptidoglycan hydrolase-like protein with peptidoglycan-binding domain